MFFNRKKYWFRVLLLVLIWSLLSLQEKSFAYNYSENINLPLLSEYGRYLYTADFKNRLLFITIFQNNCEYCQEEVRDLNELYNTPLLRKWYIFMGVDPYNSISTIKRFGNAYSADYPLYQSSLSDVYSQLHVMFTPTSFILLNGMVLGVFYGKHSYLSMKHALETIINQILIQQNNRKVFR
ncbi:MAG: TlpA family protein disulfide reductase [Desulfurella sp.]